MQMTTQTDNHKLREGVAAHKMYTLRNMCLKLQNPMIDILCRIAFWNQQKWLNKIICSNFLRNQNYTQN